jgi:hypothetical protein
MRDLVVKALFDKKTKFDAGNLAVRLLSFLTDIVGAADAQTPSSTLSTRSAWIASLALR